MCTQHLVRKTAHTMPNVDLKLPRTQIKQLLVRDWRQCGLNRQFKSHLDFRRESELSRPKRSVNIYNASYRKTGIWPKTLVGLKATEDDAVSGDMRVLRPLVSGVGRLSRDVSLTVEISFSSDAGWSSHRRYLENHKGAAVRREVRVTHSSRSIGKLCTGRRGDGSKEECRGERR